MTDKMRRFTVTKFVNLVKQPRGGYLDIKEFNKIEYTDNKTVLLEKENIPPALVGMVVDYMTRFMLSGDPIDAFTISLKGARNLSLGKKAYRLAESIDGLNAPSITAACKLASYDVAYRVCPSVYNPRSVSKPNETTINNIIIMVIRTLYFLNQKQDIQSHITFKGGYSRMVSKGDADFLTRDSIIDLKVSKYGLTSKQVLQLLIYHILYYHSDKGRFLEKIEFFNPRLNCAYYYEMENMKQCLYRHIENLIEYGVDYAIDDSENS